MTSREPMLYGRREGRAPVSGLLAGEPQADRRAWHPAKAAVEPDGA